MNHRNHVIGHLQAFRAGVRHWDSAEAQRGIDEVMAAVDGLVAAELATMIVDRNKYKAFAEQFAQKLVEHGIIKDLSPPIAGTVVCIDPAWSAAQTPLGKLPAEHPTSPLFKGRG